MGIDRSGGLQVQYPRYLQCHYSDEEDREMIIESIKGCIGCGTCVASCPTDVIRQDEANGKAFIKYPEDCQICHLCRMYYPMDAITISPKKAIPVVVSWG